MKKNVLLIFFSFFLFFCFPRSAEALCGTDPNSNCSCVDSTSYNEDCTLMTINLNQSLEISCQSSGSQSGHYCCNTQQDCTTLRTGQSTPTINCGGGTDNPTSCPSSCPAQPVGGSGQYCCGVITRFGCQAPILPSDMVSCGALTSESWRCPSTCPGDEAPPASAHRGQYCCGQYTSVTSTCDPSVPVVPTSSAQNDDGGTDTDTNPDEYSPVVDSRFLHLVNPLTIKGDNFLASLFGAANEKRFASPAAILNAALKFLFPLAGIILFVMIVWGGFEMMTGAADTKAQEAGKQRITAALIGFTLLFISYWIAQILQYIFGVNIIG